jgi:hypothetical protein
MGNIIHSAYHIDLAKEITRLKDSVIKLGINNPSNIEITALIAHKNKKAKMDKLEVFSFFRNIRGIR